MPASTVLKTKKKKPGLNSVPTNGSGGNFTESAMDEFLAKRSLYRKPIAKDGSCLFRAVSEQVYNCQARHLDVRNQCIDFMRRNRQHFEEFVEGPFDHHLFKLQNPKEWAGQVEITALSQMYRKDFVVYQDINSSPTKVTDHGFKDKILLCYSNGNHYDTIYHMKYQEHAAMCQSILFEMLYNKVFTDLDKKEASKKGKQKGTNPISSQKSSLDWLNGSITEDAETVDGNGDDFGWTEVKSKARAKHERHAKPVEVEEEKEQEENQIKPNNDQKYLWERRRSADPHLYRNISLEVWEEDKHTRQQQDLALAVSIQFKAGDRCQVKLGPPNAPVEKNYSAVIKEDNTGFGSVLVYIHELKERQTVPIQSVKPPENNQGHNYNYKELSGYHQKNKEDTTNGSIPEEGSKDDSKLKKKRPQRNRRGPGKDGDEAGNVSEESTPRGRGRQRERFNRRRFPGKNDRNMKEDEEAKFIEEQIKLVELQEKDPKAFPALPMRGSPQISPTPAINTPPAPKIEVIEITPPPPPPSPKEEKPQEQEKDEVPLAEQGTPAQFWSRLKTQNAAQGKPMNEEPVNQTKNSTPATSPIAKKPENETMNKVLPNKDESRLLEIAIDKEKENTSDKVLDEIQTNYPHRDNHETKPPQAAIQIKPLPDDNQNNKHSSHVYEVKIPKNSSPIKVVQPIKIPQPLEEKQNLLLAQAESQEPHKDDEYVLPKQEAVLSLCLNDANKEQIGTTVQDDIIPPAQYHPLPSTDTPLNMSSEDIFPESEPDFSWGEQPVNANKSKVAEPVTMATSITIATPERKTVTFADEPKEIPPVLYGQSRIVNGTNRANHIGEQVYKPSNTDDSIPTSKESQNLEQETTDKDHQTFPSSIASEGAQSSSPTTQQSQAQMPYMLPMLPQGVQLPSGPSIDPNGADLPQDTMTLRYFFNMGYHQYLMMASQMASQQLPLVYMYQGSMQDQMMQQQQATQPATSMTQQQMYAAMQQQQLAYQHQGLQTYQAPFHMPQTSQDTTSQIERAPERQTSQTQHQTQIQTPQQIQMPHQQQSGHFHQHQQQQTSLGQQSWRGGRTPRYNNPNKYQNVYHDNISQSHRPTYQQGSGGAQRQAHYRDSNKPNRKTQGGKPRNDQYSPHFASTSHSQTMANSPGASAQTTYFPVTGADHQNKNHEYYAGSGVMYNQLNYHQHGMQAGMPNVPHNSGTRPPYN